MRPCFLVIDRDFPGSISTRKLVLETAKYNVVTAYSAQEAIDTFRTFPAVHGIVLDKAIRDIPCQELIAKLRTIKSNVPIVLIDSGSHEVCDNADHVLDRYTPEALLAVVRKMLPSETRTIEDREKEA